MTRKALGILVLMVLVAPYAALAAESAESAESTDSVAVADAPTCLEAADPVASAASAWAALDAPDGWAFTAIGGEQAGCSGMVPCNTVLDCPCPDSRCACIQRSCGKTCLCLLECFQGPNPP